MRRLLYLLPRVRGARGDVHVRPVWQGPCFGEVAIIMGVLTEMEMNLRGTRCEYWSKPRALIKGAVGGGENEDTVMLVIKQALV